MLGFILDNNNDLTLDALGNIKMAEGIDAYEQHLVNRLRLQQFEYPYDVTRGINYMGYLLGKAPNIRAWESQVLQVAEEAEFVSRVDDWKYNIDGNNFQFGLTVTTDLGQITLRG